MPKNRDLHLWTDFSFQRVTNHLPQTTLKPDVVVLAVDGSSIDNLDSESRLLGLNLSELARLGQVGLHEAGVSPSSSEFLLLLGRNFARAGAKSTAKAYFSLAASVNSGFLRDWLLAAAGERDDLQNVFDSLLSLKDKNRYLTDIELTAGLEKTTMLRQKLFDQTTPLLQGFAAYRLMVSSVAAGDTNRAQIALQNAARNLAGEGEIQKAQNLTNLSIISISDAKQNAGDFFENANEWAKSTRAVLVPKFMAFDQIRTVTTNGVITVISE